MWECSLCEVRFTGESFENHILSNHITQFLSSTKASNLSSEIATNAERPVGILGGHANSGNSKRLSTKVFTCGNCHFTADCFEAIAQHCSAFLHDPCQVRKGDDFNEYISSLFLGLNVIINGRPSKTATASPVATGHDSDLSVSQQNASAAKTQLLPSATNGSMSQPIIFKPAADHFQPPAAAVAENPPINPPANGQPLAQKIVVNQAGSQNPLSATVPIGGKRSIQSAQSAEIGGPPSKVPAAGGSVKKNGKRGGATVGNSSISNNGHNIHSCPQCGITFSLQSRLAKHFEDFHSGSLSEAVGEGPQPANSHAHVSEEQPSKVKQEQQSFSSAQLAIQQEDEEEEYDDEDEEDCVEEDDIIVEDAVGYEDDGGGSKRSHSADGTTSEQVIQQLIDGVFNQSSQNHSIDIVKPGQQQPAAVHNDPNEAAAYPPQPIQTEMAAINHQQLQQPDLLNDDDGTLSNNNEAGVGINRSRQQNEATTTTTTTTIMTQRNHPIPSWNERQPCGQCGKTLANRGSLLRHLSLIHNLTSSQALPPGMRRAVTKEKQIYPCPTCGAKFTQPYNVPRHIRMVHKVEPAPDVAANAINESHVSQQATQSIGSTGSAVQPESFTTTDRAWDMNNNDINNNNNNNNTKIETMVDTSLLLDSSILQGTNLNNSTNIPLQQQQQLQLQLQLQQYPCQLCGKILSRKDKLGDHMRRMHSGNYSNGGGEEGGGNMMMEEDLMKESDEKVVID